MKLNVALDIARLALDGKKTDGSVYACSMFDPSVDSFSHGEGTRRPYFEVVKAIKSGLERCDGLALENYHFLTKHELLEQEIIKSFKEYGVRNNLLNCIHVDFSSTRIITNFLKKYCHKGSVVLAASPIYHPLIKWCEECNLVLDLIEVTSENDYKLTVKDLENYSNNNEMNKVSCLFFFNPGYSGQIYSKKEIDDIAKFISDYDFKIVEDGIFLGCEYKEKTSLLSSSEHLKNEIVLCSGASKKHNLANLRIGWLCGTEHIVSELKNYSYLTLGSVTMLNQEAAYHALKAPSEFYTQNNHKLNSRSLLILEAINSFNYRIKVKYGIHYNPIGVLNKPQSGHSLLIKFNILQDKSIDGLDLSLDSNITLFFLKYAHVSFAPGCSHGLPGWNRVSYGCFGAKNHYEYQKSLETTDIYTESDISEYFSKGSETYDFVTNKIISIFEKKVFKLIERVIDNEL